MDDLAAGAQTIGKFLQTFTLNGGLRLRFRVKLRGVKSDNPDTSETPQFGSAAPGLYVEFTGPDTSVLTVHNGEVLNALEHVAVRILRLEPEEHDRVIFDADHFKANRDRQMRESAEMAIERVRTTGRPHPFPPMNSRERRMLHLILKDSGLPTASSGEGPGRFVVLYPHGADTSEPLGGQQPRRADDSSRIRQAFRHR